MSHPVYTYTYPHNTCPECSSNLIIDSDGKLVCPSCGLVVEERPYMMSPNERRDAEIVAMDYHVVIKPYIVNNGIGMAKYEELNAKDRAFFIASSKMLKLRILVGREKDLAGKILREVLEVQKRVREITIYAIVYIVCRYTGRCDNIKEFIKKYNIKGNLPTAVFKVISISKTAKEIYAKGSERKTSKLTTTIVDVVSKLGLGKSKRECVLKKAMKYLEECRADFALHLRTLPYTLVLLACKACKVNITVEGYCRKFGIHTAVIYEVLKKLRQKGYVVNGVWYNEC